jgi:long-chain acyl-CoA synthetase
MSREGGPADGFTPRFDTLAEIFEHSTAAFRDLPLFGTKRGGAWTWMDHGAFRTEVERVRTGLAGLGIGRGDAMALISNNRAEWAISAYAAYGLGAAVVPMYEAQQDEDWRYILADSGAGVAFVADAAIRDRVDASAGDLPSLQHVIALAGDDADDRPSFARLGLDAETRPPEQVSADDIAGFVYTSGTTGRPKGVLLSHGNLARNVSAITEVFPLETDDRTLSFLPWAHAFGQTVELHTILATGASTAFAESPRTIVANLSEVQPTMLVSVPRIFTRIHDGIRTHVSDSGRITRSLFDAAMENGRKRRALADAGKRSRWLDAQHAALDRIVLSKIRNRFGGKLEYAISGGAAIPEEVALFIDALGITVFEGYGLSETSPIATANWPGSRRIGSVGKPIPGVRVEIDTAVSADPRDGEIIVHGHNVMQGYHNLPDKTAEALTPDGGFRTGDLGRIDEDGFLHITGRVKEQYKLANGKYVVPTVIEEQLVLSPFILNAMVFGEQRPFNVALIVPDVKALAREAAARGWTFDPAAVRHDPNVRDLLATEIESQSERIHKYERVRDFAVLGEDFTVENGMLTPTLKLKRSVVRDRFSTDLEDLYQPG